MTLLVRVGRRMPKNWLRRTMTRLGGLIAFQENIWLMIIQSFSLARKKCNASGKGEWAIIKEKESESLHYDIVWFINIIKGTREFEEEEYKDTFKLYDTLGNIMKKELPIDENLKKMFKSKILSPEKVMEAYKAGYGSSSESNISNKLLEMGILTHIELIDDYNTRNDIIKTDF